MKFINVLHVDDDEDLRQEVKDYLTRDGFNVLGAGTLKECLEILRTKHVQAIVLDSGLPDGHGLDALPELRRNTACPIVMMTAWGQLSKRLQALNSGVDYYLVKPVSLEELSSVLSVTLRRNSSDVGWRSDAVSRTLISADGNSVKLTSTEWLFVQALRKCQGLIVSREELIHTLGKEPAKYDSRCMDTLVQRLRLKAKQAGIDKLPLHTRHGQGYIWQEQSH